MDQPVIQFQEVFLKQELVVDDDDDGDKREETNALVVPVKHIEENDFYESKVETISSQKAHCCKICNQKFAHEESLEQHMIIHTLERPYDCEVCGKTYKKYEYLKRHLIVHSNAVILKKCKICKMKFPDKASFDIHKKTHGAPSKNFVCTICGRGLSDRRWFNYHMMTQHGQSQD